MTTEEKRKYTWKSSLIEGEEEIEHETIVRFESSPDICCFRLPWERFSDNTNELGKNQSTPHACLCVCMYAPTRPDRPFYNL